MTQVTTEANSSTEAATTRRVLQRLILPADRDLDVMPLYVDVEAAVLDADKLSVGTSREAKNINSASLRQSTSTGRELSAEEILGRHSLLIRAGEKISLGSYFNAFPASYWRKWTVVEQVRLNVTLQGRGTMVVVYRSMANGRSQRVDSATVQGDGSETFSFDLTLVPFQDGGWYWFDVVAPSSDTTLIEATWDAEVPAERMTPGTCTIGITTMNRPDFCAKLIKQISDDPLVSSLVDEVVVAEQGTKLVSEDPNFPAAEAGLGGRLRVIEQANLGGSGGFARAQYETLQSNRSTYVLFLDDDIVMETESILRTITFGDLCRKPSIVGGHMFSLFRKTQLHSFGEVINRWRFWWMSPLTVNNDWDFSARNLRSTRWLHRRIDVDFNPWFFCLIPTQVVKEIGLGLPLFIKWDDSEYGVRAQAAGFPTISMPGAAVWHVPWSDKNDALDWQAYFHQRNRFVAALLHSPFPRGGRMVRESLNHTVFHLISMRYSTVELRLQAMEDVLAGPHRLHPDLATKLGEIRQLRTTFEDANLKSDPQAFPPVRREKPRKKALSHEVLNRPSEALQALKGGIRQFLPVRPLSREFPESEIMAQDSFWWNLASQDSAIVSMPDGTSASFLKRQPELFRSQLARAIALHKQMLEEWPRLSKKYQDSLSEITSPETWAVTFGVDQKVDD